MVYRCLSWAESEGWYPRHKRTGTKGSWFSVIRDYWWALGKFAMELWRWKHCKPVSNWLAVRF